MEPTYNKVVSMYKKKPKKTKAMNLHIEIYLFNYINDNYFNYLLNSLTLFVLVFPLLTFKIKYRLGDY